MTDAKNSLHRKQPKSKPPKRKLIYAVIILIILIGGIVIFSGNFFSNPNLESTSNAVDTSLGGIFEPLANLLHIDTDANHPNTISTKLGTAEEGFVTLEGPYGNTSSKVKIAYIIGQHPRESDSHQALENAVKNISGDWEYQYYIYKINVTANSSDFSESRMNGQLLAQQFVVPDVVSKDYSLVCDIHTSNAFYFPDPYIFTPGSANGTSHQIANKIVKNNSWLYYYEPPEYSSPKYCTQPILENGTPALVYEAHGQPGLSVQQQLTDLVITIDNLKT